MSVLLIDTHVLLGLAELPDAAPLPKSVLDEIETASSVVLSAASVFEVNQKIRVGKLAAPLLDDRSIARIEEQGIAVEAVTAAIMARAASLRWRYNGRDHRDPFDRMIAATAMALSARLMSADQAFDALALERLWG